MSDPFPFTMMTPIWVPNRAADSLAPDSATGTSQSQVASQAAGEAWNTATTCTQLEATTITGTQQVGMNWALTGPEEFSIAEGDKICWVFEMDGDWEEPHDDSYFIIMMATTSALVNRHTSANTWNGRIKRNMLFLPSVASYTLPTGNPHWSETGTCPWGSTIADIRIYWKHDGSATFTPFNHFKVNGLYGGWD